MFQESTFKGELMESAVSSDGAELKASWPSTIKNEELRIKNVRTVNSPQLIDHGLLADVRLPISAFQFSISNCLPVGEVGGAFHV